ncbi:MAG TPA: nucleotidyltransferase family protein [Acidimicrobiales bacterium]|nr:nucleotidyltransferase family protein [Acidimicrobiales bacterium]
MSAAAVVLAAGGGSRFGGEEHKLLTSFRGKPLWRWAVDAAREAGLDVIVVSGAVPLDGAVHNERWREGMATSLQVGLAAAEAGGHDAVVVGLADQPLVPPSAWQAVASAEGAPIAVATYGGRRRNPVRLSREVWPLLPTTGDEGARVVMRERPDLVVEVACEGEPADVDTVEDLQAWS